MPLNKKKLLRWGCELSLLVLIVGAVITLQSKDMLSADGSSTVPEARLVSLSGEVLPLAERGKRTLIYFWAPWCQICALSIGSLQNIEQQDLHVVTVAMDYDSVESVAAFVAEHDVQNTVLLGTQAIKQDLQILGYPSYYLVNEQRKIVAKSYGLNTSVGIKMNNWLAQLRESAEKP